MGGEATTERVTALLNELFPLARKHGVGPADSLFASGILDSLGVLDLVAALEEAFDFTIADDDLIPENFESIAQIVAFVQSSSRG